jgi:DNA-binding NarL/FixJ family response regulator
LFTDIVGSTSLAAELGDARWRKLLDDHDALVRAKLSAEGGREVKTVGDGFVATFASPSAAIRCARSVIEGAHGLDVKIRAGLHTGEVERRGRDVGGIGVHVAARVAALAGPDEILVSATVKDVCDGSGVLFESRGTHALRGVPGRRRLYAVADERRGPTTSRPSTTNKGPRKTSPTRKKGSSSPEAIRVLVADDHPLWRQTLRGLLESQGAAVVVAEAANGEEAVTAARSANPDVVLMDIDMPRLDGMEATRQITRASDTRVLMLSSLKERDEVLAAVRAGASGYLLKTAEAEEVAEAIRRVHGGEIAFPAELTAIVLAELRAPQRADEATSGVKGLTEREHKVMDLIAEGRSNKAIATQLHVAPKTLETHIASIFTKLGLEATPDHHRRVQAVLAYLGRQELRANP